MTSRTENRIRIRKAADHILKGHSAQATVALVAETDGVENVAWMVDTGDVSGRIGIAGGGVLAGW